MAHLTLGLLRHGETDWNVASRLQGTSDIALNETGIAQAMTAAKAIDGSEWDLIIASPLSRARDTARIVAESNALGEITIEPLLMERAFGEAEGLNYHEWKKQHDAHQTVLGGESLPDLEARAHRLLAHLAKTYASLPCLRLVSIHFMDTPEELCQPGQLYRPGRSRKNAEAIVGSTFGSW